MRPAVPEHRRWTPAEVVPFLTKPVVEGQDSVGLAEFVGDVCLQVIADVVGVPGGPVQQLLQAVGGAVACVFGQLPAVFAADRAEPGADVVPHAASQVGAAEAVADTQEEIVEFMVPGRVGMVVDHAGRLPSSPRRQFSMSFVGGAVRQDHPRHAISPLHSGRCF